jgi:transposase
VRGTKDKEHAMAEALNHSITFAGIDIGKNSFHVVGLDGRGAIVLRQKWSRGQVEARFANMPPCLIGWRLAWARIISAAGSRGSATMPD